MIFSENQLDKIMNVSFKTNNLNDLAILIQMAKRLNIEVEKIDDVETELKIDELTDLSLQSFKNSWDSEEDNIWDDFFKETQLQDK